MTAVTGLYCGNENLLFMSNVLYVMDQHSIGREAILHGHPFPATDSELDLAVDFD